MQKGYWQEMTQDGFDALQQEYNDLLKQRPDAVEHLKRAREMGDLSENGYYKASKAKLVSIDNRLFHLKNLLKWAKVIKATSAQQISLGNHITLKHQEKEITYLLVSKFEANPSEGKISNVSPLGKLLLGKKTGDSVVLRTPKGEQNYTVVKIVLSQ